MRTIPPALQSHLNGTSKTLATIWRIVRRDGQVFRFADHDRDLVVGGETYEAATGYARSAVTNALALTVGEGELAGLLVSDSFTEQDVRNGLWDYARYTVSVVNWAAPSDGTFILSAGWLGEIVIDETGQFRTELRSLKQRLQQRVGEVYSSHCRADFADGRRCHAPAEPPAIGREAEYEAGAVVRVPIGGTGTLADDQGLIWECITAGTTAAEAPVYTPTIGAEVTDGTAAFRARAALSQPGVVEGSSGPRNVVLAEGFAAIADTWAPARLAGGIVVFETGANAGRRAEILAYDEGTRTLTLFEGAPFAIEAGDALYVVPPCDKRAATCRKFGMWQWFRGEPLVPGQDAMLQVGRPPA